jgi:hypothetical protein
MPPKLVPVFCVVCAVSGFQLVSALSPIRPHIQSPAQSPSAAAASQKPSPFSGLDSAGEPSSILLQEVAPKGTSLRELSINSETAGSPAQSRLALMEAISKLSPSALEAMLAKEASSTDFYRSSRFDFQFAARRLSEIAPEKAAALWLNAKSSHYGVDALLLPWAKKDPQAFASWSTGLPADAQRAMAGTLGQLVAENPERLTGIAAQLAGSPAGALGARGAISGMISRAAKGSDPADALAYAQALPAGPMRSAALAELARWPGMDLSSHPEVADALAALAPSEARRYIPQIAGSAANLPQGEVRDAAYSAQFTAAAKRDPQAAAKRVDALTNTADYPAAVRGFVEATAAKDPAAAVEWALSISTLGNQRSAALEKAATEYFRLKPADARKWVKNAPLSAAEYTQLTGQTR